MMWDKVYIRYSTVSSYGENTNLLWFDVDYVYFWWSCRISRLSYKITHAFKQINSYQNVNIYKEKMSETPKNTKSTYINSTDSCTIIFNSESCINVPTYQMFESVIIYIIGNQTNSTFPFYCCKWWNYY